MKSLKNKNTPRTNMKFKNISKLKMEGAKVI